jgi:hypothetical protein
VVEVSPRDGAAVKKKTIELLISDLDIGCDELGWMPRNLKWTVGGMLATRGYDPDDEDAAYARFVKKNKGIDIRVVHGTAYLPDDHALGASDSVTQPRQG